MINTTQLRTLRVDRGCSIRSLAKAAGVDHQTIRRLENGADPGDLPLRVLNRLAAALGVQPATLLAETEAAGQPALTQQVGGLILAAPGITITNLAAAVETDINDVRAALPALAAALASAGLTLTRDGDALRVAPRELHFTTAADSRPMTVNEARLLRRIHRGQDVRRSLSKADRELTLPSLVRRGLVDIGCATPKVFCDLLEYPALGNGCTPAQEHAAKIWQVPVGPQGGRRGAGGRTTRSSP